MNDRVNQIIDTYNKLLAPCNLKIHVHTCKGSASNEEVCEKCTLYHNESDSINRVCLSCVYISKMIDGFSNADEIIDIHLTPLNQSSFVLIDRLLEVADDILNMKEVHE